MPSRLSSRQSLAPDSVKEEPLAQPSTGIAQTGPEITPTGKNQRGGAKRKRERTGNSIDRGRGEISKKAKRSIKFNGVEEEEAPAIKSPSQVTSKRARTKKEEVVIRRDESSKDIKTSLAKRESKVTIKQESADIDDEEDRDSAEGSPAKPKKEKRKRKTKEEKEAEAMPIAARTTGLRMFIGAHVSSAKGWSRRLKKEIGLYIMKCELK